MRCCRVISKVAGGSWEPVFEDHAGKSSAHLRGELRQLVAVQTGKHFVTVALYNAPSGLGRRHSNAIRFLHAVWARTLYSVSLTRSRSSIFPDTAWPYKSR